jgi:hypothetical protein
MQFWGRKMTNAKVNSRRIARLGLLSASPIALSVGLMAFAATPAAAVSVPSCTLSTPTVWSDGNGTWGMSANWTPGVIPDSSTANVCITDGTSTVTIPDISPTFASLQIGGGNTLTTDGSHALEMFGPSLMNNGNLNLNGALELHGDVTLSGSGTLTMTGVPNPSTGGQIGTDGNDRTLTNQSTIQGSGLIGSNAVGFQNLSLSNSGTINGNSTTNALEIGGTGGSVTNTGTFKATGGGTLILNPSAAINNSGGNITASGTGSTVSINAKIEGGTINTSSGGVVETASGGATLDATTQGAITLSDGSTYTATAGTTKINGTLNLGTLTGSALALGGALELVGDTTLTGPTGAVVTMTGVPNPTTGGQIGTDGNAHTLTNDTNVVIQGSGLIGSNSVTFQNLSLDNKGTINANSTANALEIAGTGGSVTNTGALKATGGGTLILAPSAAINNSGGAITASGTGSTVTINATIQGGTLNTSSSGVMETASGGATLDATTHGAITVSDGSTYTATAGTTKITGTLNLGTMTGSTLSLGGALELVGDTTLSGPSGAAVTMTGVPNPTTGGQIGTDGNGHTLTNNVLIQGSGVIGSNAITFQNLSLDNTDVIDKCFFAGSELFSSRARAAAWRRAGREAQAQPRSLHRRTSVAAPVCTRLGPRGFQPATKRA